MITPSTPQTLPEAAKIALDAMLEGAPWMGIQNGDGEEIGEALDASIFALQSALAAQPQAVAVPAISEQDRAFEIVSAWLLHRKTAANGAQLASMCEFAMFVLAAAPQAAGQQEDAKQWIQTAQAELDGIEIEDENNCLKAAKGALQKAVISITNSNAARGES